MLFRSVFAIPLTFKTTFSTMNEILNVLTNTSDNATWHDVVVTHTPAQRAIDLKNEIVSNGLEHGKDFEWRWTGSTWDSMTGQHPSETRFSFREESMATFYRLKWQ